MYIIVGLGNYPKEYDMTKHNVGFYILDKIANKYNIELSKKKFKGIYGTGKINDTEVILVKPQTYMNLSGECVRDIVNFYKLPLTNVIIIYDDIDIPFGTIRYREKGSAGTHNGMRNIVSCLNSQDVKRIRIGITGDKNENIELKDYVLSRFSKHEQEELEKISDNVITKLEDILS